MLSRRRHFVAVVSAVPDRLGNNRPKGEIWTCVLSCGHSEWRPRLGRIEDGPRRAPTKLICSTCERARASSDTPVRCSACGLTESWAVHPSHFSEPLNECGCGGKFEVAT